MTPEKPPRTRNKDERTKYFDNLISGISMFLAGPFGLKLAFHAFVVLVGALILSGAVNTAIIGSNDSNGKRVPFCAYEFSVQRAEPRGRRRRTA